LAILAFSRRKIQFRTQFQSTTMQ